MATSEWRPTELERRPGPKDKESVILNSTDEGGGYIYFNTLYQAAFKEGQNKWRDIGIALNLDPNELTSIGQIHQVPRVCFEQMLFKWFQVNEECYLSTFIEALRASNVELVSLIPRVEEAIISTHTQETRNTEVSRTRPRKRGPSETSLSEMEPNKRRPSERLSGQVRSGDQVKPLSPPTVNVSVEDEIKKFEKRFSDLQTAALEEITESKISVSKFRHKLTTLPVSIKNEHKNFVIKHFSLFEKAESIEGIFVYLNFYLSYIEFDLLEYIIEQFGSERLKEDMSRYAHDMTQFKARTTISNALPYLHKPRLSDQKNIPDGLSELRVEFNVDVNIATLEKLDELRKIHADEFQLSHLAFFLSKLQKRSLLVTWLVSTSLETTISDKIQEKNVSFFSNNNILELSLGGKQLYPFKKEIGQPETSSDQCPEVTTEPDISDKPQPDDTDTKPSVTQILYPPSAKEKYFDSPKDDTGQSKDKVMLDDTSSLIKPIHHTSSKPSEISTLIESPTKVSQSSVNKPTVDTVTAKPHHSSKYSDPDPRHRETADKIRKLIKSTPDCCGLAIMIPWRYIELNILSKFLSSTCRFAVYNPLVDPIPSWWEPLIVRSTMESVHLVELKHRPIVVVASGRYIIDHDMYTDHGGIDIKDDIVEPVFSPATPHLADNPKIFLFISALYDYDIFSIQTIFPSSGGNYIVGFISCYDDVDSVTSTILCALESPQESVQEIFKYLDCEINQLCFGQMTVIDHLKEPVYLHPDAPQGTHSGPGPTKKLPVSEQLEEVTSTVEKLNIDEDKKTVSRVTSTEDSTSKCLIS